ncbi:MAG: phage holin family protein [bacterium]|nr:phage holin family protein [bacterium]
MKKITRMILFSSLALYITSLWNHGFSLPQNPLSFIKAALLIAILFYIIVPVSKLVLLPINILTMGLASVVLYCFLLYIISSQFALLHIAPWNFDGIKLGFIIPRFTINYIFNILLSATSIATIINLLERII